MRRVLLFAALLAATAPAELLADGFQPITPCRLIDTRTGNAPALNSSATRNFKVRGTCGIPSTATAISIAVTALQPTIAGSLRLFPSDVALPLVATVSFEAGTVAETNSTLIEMPADFGSTTDLGVYFDPASGAGTSDLVIDASGYFLAAP